MSITITPESKNTLTIIPEDKSGISDTWAMHPETWGESGGTWSAPGFPIILETKNSLTITPEDKI